MSFRVTSSNAAINASCTAGATTASLVTVVTVGVCLGFLPYNVHAARMFMGDSGSLAIGGAVAGLAIIIQIIARARDIYGHQ